MDMANQLQTDSLLQLSIKDSISIPIMNRICNLILLEEEISRRMYIRTQINIRNNVTKSDQ